MLRSLGNLKGYGLVLQTVFVFSMLTNVIGTGWIFAACLLCGLLCIEDLWTCRQAERISGKWDAALHLLSAAIAAAIVACNLNLFDPVRSVISVFNIGCTVLGGWIAFFGFGKRILKDALGKRQEHLPSLGRLLLVMAWVLALRDTDSRLSVYIFCGIIGAISMWENQAQPPALTKRQACWTAAFAGLFSFATLLANYQLFQPIFTSIPILLAAFYGGFTVAWNCLGLALSRLPLTAVETERRKPVQVFFLAAGMIAVIDLLALFFYLYPGILTRDSTTTIAQILGTRPYNNSMPFWHTMTVQLFVKLGLTLFGTMNGAVSFFHCAQILLLAASMGAVIVTLYQIGAPRGLLVGVFCLYAFQPYNVVLSVTLWKDVPFGCAAVLVTVGLFRLLKNIGHSRILNWAIFLFGAVGFSLWRTNGWYAFLAVFGVMVFLLGKKQKNLLFVMAWVLVLCWVLINPVLDFLGVSGTNMVEALGIPMQQVARVVANDRDLTESQEEALSEIFDLEQVAQLYTPGNVDPIKFTAFRRDRKDYLFDNGGAYLKLYLSLGMAYPRDYLEAWIEQTKGFWNGGYEYPMYVLKTIEEENGLVQTDGQNLIGRLFRSAFRLMEMPPMMRIFPSIGLYVWGLIGCCLVNVLKKRDVFLLTIPILVLIVGLWLGTPVFCEFRYAYPLMLTLPLIGGVTLYWRE